MRWHIHGTVGIRRRLHLDTCTARYPLSATPQEPGLSKDWCITVFTNSIWAEIQQIVCAPSEDSNQWHPRSLTRLVAKRSIWVVMVPMPDSSYRQRGLWPDCVDAQADLSPRRSIISKLIWAATCDFQQCGILTSVDSDEPVQPPFKLRISKWCSASSLTLREYTSD